MSSVPYIAHSELTNEIYIIDGKNKHCVTDQVIKAMRATNRLLDRENTIQEIVDIVNDSEYPEYLEENILEWLESKGVKV